jgi:hypothetical protein
MLRRLLALLVAAPVLALAGSAAAIQVPFTGTFSIESNLFFLISPNADAGAGTAEVEFAGTAPQSLQFPADAFAINRGSMLGPFITTSVTVQTEAAAFSDLATSPSGALPVTGSVNYSEFSGFDPFDPFGGSYNPVNGAFIPPVERIGVPGAAVNVGSFQDVDTLAQRTITWSPAPWSLTWSGNELQGESLGALTCTGSLYGACPGATFGATFSIVLALDPGQAGFGPGSGQAALLGGSGTAGGLDISLDVSAGEGLLSASFQQATLADITSGFGVALPFALPSGVTSLWEITGGDQFQGTAELTFAYDPALLPVGFDEAQLAMAHLKNGSWELLTGIVDAGANTITVETDSFSPFSLVSVPEPATSALVATGLFALATGRKRRS